MPTASADSFAAIDLTWTTVQDAFEAAYTSAKAEDRPRVQAIRDMARDAWYAALNKVFHQSDTLVAELTTDLQSENAALVADAGHLKKAEAYLSLAKSAAKTAAALSKLAV